MTGSKTATNTVEISILPDHWSIGNQTVCYPYVCPDLLNIAQIGHADTWRGRFIRWFFQLMRLWG